MRGIERERHHSYINVAVESHKCGCRKHHTKRQRADRWGNEYPLPCIWDINASMCPCLPRPHCAPRSALYHGQHYTTPCTSPRAALHHGQHCTTVSTIPCHALHHGQHCTTVSTAPRSALHHGQHYTTPCLLLLDQVIHLDEFRLKLGQRSRRRCLMCDCMVWG